MRNPIATLSLAKMLTRFCLVKVFNTVINTILKMLKGEIKLCIYNCSLKIRVSILNNKIMKASVFIELILFVANILTKQEEKC